MGGDGSFNKVEGFSKETYMIGPCPRVYEVNITYLIMFNNN